MEKKKLTMQEVEHVAKLARIELSSEEKSKFQEHLGEILTYIDQINEVETDDVEPTWQVTGLKNVMREDKIRQSDLGDELVDLAPDKDGKQIKVPSVFK